MRKITIHILTLLSVTLSLCSISAQNTNSQKLRWRVLGELPSSKTGSPSGLAGAFTGASGDLMWIAGGSNFSNGLPWEGGSKLFHDTVYFFRKNGKGMDLLPVRDRLPLAIAYGTSIAWQNGVVCVGGQNQTGFSAKVFFVSIKKEKPSLQYKTLADLPAGLANASGTLYRNTLYIAGGETVDGPSNQFLSLDMSKENEKWKMLPKLPKPVSHAILVTQSNGKDTSLYLLGGRRKDISGISEFYADMYRYDFITASWQACTPMPYALSAHTGIAFAANEILVFGGDKGTVFNKVEKALVAIGKENDPGQKATLVNLKNELQNSHPGFSREVLSYNTLTGKWTLKGVLPFPTPVTTTAFIWDRSVIIPSGEIKAGVRSPEIWMGALQ